MPRPDRSPERRAKLLPLLARAFAELGYRRATTAALATRCKTQEAILYRLWPDKKTMFVAVIAHVYEASTAVWEQLLAGKDKRSAAERLLEYEASHHGEFGLYRLVFAGLSELDDPEVRHALSHMYTRYHEFIVRRLLEHRSDQAKAPAELIAWALIGMGTVSSIGRELGLLTPAKRRRMWQTIGHRLLSQHPG
jgi:AcrR family transcriptional regulator